MLKNKDFKTIYYSAGNQCYPSKEVPQVNLVIPPVVNRLISVWELKAVAIKHLVELSVEHEFFGHFFSKRKTCHVFFSCQKNLVGMQKWVWISYGKQAIEVQAIEVWLYNLHFFPGAQH